MKLLTQEYREHWTLASKLLFRLLATYFVLYIFFIVLNPFFEAPFRWIGDTVFGISYEYKVRGNGSGDNTYAYLTFFVTVFLTLIVVAVWSVIDRTRKSYNKLFYLFLLFLRGVLITAMFFYGFAKVFKLQFPSASLTHLLDRLGDFSPMGLAWTYMGFSKGFNVFIGFLEVLGGLLLIPRRTQTLGSFVIIGVMTQVVVMNFCYDIPVKLFSVHLVLMALVVFSTDHRLLSVFIKNTSVAKYEYYHPVTNITYHKVVFWVKTVGLLIVVGLISYNFYSKEKSLGDDRAKPFLYGIWETTTFIKNGDTLQPLLTDSYRWRYLIVDFKEEATVKTMDDAKHYYKLSADSTSQKIQLHKRGSKAEGFNFKYKKPSTELLQFYGIIDSDTLYVEFTKKDHEKFDINARGFHWITEEPFIR